MPELPEVETVVNNLRPKIANQIILGVKVLCPKILAFDYNLIINQQIFDIIRRGKYIILNLDIGYLVIHLRMTGKLFAISKLENLANYQKHLHVIFELSGNYLLFADQRQFGRISYHQDLTWLENKLGPEPLLEYFTLDYLIEICNSSRPIKVLLLDQSKIAGLGNIYVDEVLWQAGVHPKTNACNILNKQIKLIYHAIRQILQSAINMQGTTFLSYAFDGNQKGNFLQELKVFKRDKLPCLRCGNVITKIKVAQRGTHICEKCQELKRI